ncbi:type I polyketide synthase [Streptomyces sp. NPDC057909]|uniref:type I polyketide synthase n=1 Tax=Streptomyces sp. NPDC057909 TaxID=3346277 RepID=UPI0036EE41B3
MNEIAIVGLDCRFPGAPDAEAFWDLLMRAGDGGGEVPPDRWNAVEWYDPNGSPGHTNTTRGGFVDDPGVFDSEFFAVSPREAEAMDPQQRLFLGTVWRALEDAGIPPHKLADTAVGVYAGVMASEWGQLQLRDYANVTAQTGAGSSCSMVANRVSYHLNLKGPSLAVDTACSSSLVAVHLAVNALLSGEVDHAVAGGVNLQLTPALGIFYTQAGLSAPDGRCKPFSTVADGIGRGDGVGAVVLRRMEDALAAGQQVYAVIRGTAVNQDGRSNGLTAPSRWAQQEVLAAALRRAAASPGQVDFIETHGTGTALGDMIETKALGHVYGAGREQPCAIGSVKGNIGHTEATAGIAGLIKVALALHHRIVPASPFATRENPKLALRSNGLRLLKTPMRLPSGPVLAGLSSFGMGGTNAHAVLASAPSRARQRSLADKGVDTPVVFSLSANNQTGLRRNVQAQADWLARRKHESVAPLAWSSNQVKTTLPHRFAVVARSTGELSRKLAEAAADPEEFAIHTSRPEGRHQVAFLFTGQGAQFAGMTRRLYQESPLYRGYFDEADEALQPHLGQSARDLVFAADDRIHQTGHAQPALFAVGYALARTMTSLGAEPAAVLGHSVGEFAAAVTAGVLSLDDAAQLVSARGSLMQALPAGGGMTAVRVGAEEIADLVAEEPLVDIAVLNGPDATVLSGELEALGRIAQVLRRRGVDATPLRVSHAFHSCLMAPMLTEFSRVAHAVRPRAPQVPLYSTLLGRATDTEAMDGDYWMSQVAQPVRFADAVRELVNDGPKLLIEIGPKPVLTPLVRKLRSADDLVCLHPAPGKEAGGNDLAEAVAALFIAGIDPDWTGLYGEQDRRLQRLHPYEFSAQRRYWDLPVAIPAASAPRADDRRPADQPSPDDRGAAESAAPAPSPDTDRVAHAVRTAIAEASGYELGEIVLRSRLYEDLGLDSVQVMQLKVRIETALPELSEFTVQQLLPHLTTVGALIEFLREHSTAATPRAS